MQFLLAVLISGAIFVAYSLLEANENLKSDTPISSGWFSTDIAPTVAGYVPQDLLAVVDIPAVGCSSSILPKERVAALVAALPTDQAEGLSQLLDTGSGIWQAQLYLGEQGIGICLPARNALVLLPSAVKTMLVAAP